MELDFYDFIFRLLSFVHHLGSMEVSGKQDIYNHFLNSVTSSAVPIVWKNNGDFSSFIQEISWAFCVL